ncbi:hypothetical protein ACN6KF_001496 [Labrys sp. La1]|uniref:hypothetical protein n=1 Tax=Labrys sp. La1 TaxID=3404917 RepID=UPI003EBB3242
MNLVRAVYFRVGIAFALRRYRRAVRLSGHYTDDALHWRSVAEALIAKSKSPTANR